MRRGALIALALGTALLTSGCSVAVNGVTGVGVDANGQLVGYVKVCSFHTASLVLWTDAEGRPVGEWTPPEAITDFGSWSLDDSTDGWSTEVAPPARTDDDVYQLEGWTDELLAGTARTVGIRYTVRDLAALRPGEVLWTVSRFREEPPRTTVTSVDEFRLTACTASYDDADLSPTPSSSGS